MSSIVTVERPPDVARGLRGLLGHAPDWVTLAQFLPDDWKGDPQRRRSATAAHFAAALELAKQGTVQISQTDSFAPLRLRATPT